MSTRFFMVNQGNEHTMLGQWRIAVRQAEEAIRAGRLEEAYEAVSRPEAADHQQAVHLRARIALDLVARGIRRAEADDVEGAIVDLDKAESFGAPPDQLAAARFKVSEAVSDEIRLALEASRPDRVVERIDHLLRHKVCGPALRRMREVADSWRTALAEGRKGELGRSIENFERALRLAEGPAKQAVLADRTEVESRQKDAHARIEALYDALGKNDWSKVLSLSEEVLGLLPEHPASLHARAKAWRQLASIAPNASLPHPGGGRSAQQAAAPNPDRPLNLFRGIWPDRHRNNRPAEQEAAPHPTPQPPSRALAQSAGGDLKGRFLLWVDTIGGFLVCLDNEVQIGRAGPDGTAQVPVLGDLARNHATIIRGGEGYILRAKEPTFVNGNAIETAALRDRDIIRLGSSVEFEFRQPSPISGTARLAVVSRHRLPLAVDGVILMAETCILSRSHQAHIHAPNLKDPVVLFNQGGSLWCKCTGGFEVDGRNCIARAPLDQRSSVLGDGFSFSLEPLEVKLSTT